MLVTPEILQAIMSLSRLVENSNDKRHDLLTWTIEKIEIISKIPENVTEEDNDGHIQLEALHQTFKQLEDFFKQMALSETPQDLDSHQIFNSLSQLSAMVLFRLKKTSPGKIYDLAELLTYILSEEDLSTMNKDDNAKKTKKKSTKKKYMFKPAKDMAAVVLLHIFELYQDDLKILVPSLYTTIFKNLKKILEKPKYYHATFMVSLTTLLSTIMRNDESESLASIISKYTKLSSNVFEIIYEYDNSLPVDMIAMIIDGWVSVLTHDTYIKDHSDNLISSIYSKFQESEFAIYGFANDGTRPYTAKVLAEVLFIYQYHKGIIELKDVFELYVKLFSNAKTRDIKSGCFESIIHFISLNIYSNKEFLNGNFYLDIINHLSSIFSNKNIEHSSLSTLSRYSRYFKHMHKVLFPYISDISKTQMLIKLTNEIPTTSEFKESENQWTTILNLELLETLLKYLSSSFISEEQLTKTLKDKLLNLCTSDMFTLRLHGCKVMKVFLFNCPQFIYEIIESSLNLLVNAFNNKDNTPYSVLHGNAYLISILISISNKTHVPYELIMRITVFATSFIKNNTTSTSSSLYYKGLICWILMIGLMNYKDPTYLSMQTSQLFLFWKVLLTHSFTYRTEDDLSRNLEIRTHALTCLLSFLNNTKIDSTMAKQISYLLTKCSNFNHSVSLKSNGIDRILLHNECKILQVYLKIKDFIKYDFDSSLLILITKNFSDPNLYISDNTNIIKSLKNMTKQKSKIDQGKEYGVDHTVDSILRGTGDFAYGLSSKIHKNRISVSGSCDISDDEALVNSLWHTKDLTWCDNLEEEVLQPISPAVTNDSLVLLYGNFSYERDDYYLPNITTSLVDFSMELFSSIFPFLNSKIQYSVLENLNLSVFSKATTPLRSVALTANVCTAIYGCLQDVQQQNLTLEEFVGNSMIDTLKKIEFQNDAYLTTLKSECIGLICSAVARSANMKDKQAFIDEQIRILIKALVEVEEPYPRKLCLLTLSTIYKHNSKIASFTEIVDVLLTLLKDPHPVIHSWTLRALLHLLEKNVSTDIQLMSQLLQSLENYLTDSAYGLYGSSSISYNYNKEFNSQIMIIMLTNSLTEKLGPNFVELKKEVISSFKNIALSSLLSSNQVCSLESLKIYENIATFKVEGLFIDGIFMETLYHAINQSINIGLGSAHNNSVFTKQTESVEFTSSPIIAYQAFVLLNQLFKLGKVNLFSDDMELVSWRYLALHPENESIQSFFNEWLLLTIDDEKWLHKFHTMMNVSDEKLFEGHFDFFYTIERKKARYVTTSTQRDQKQDTSAVNSAHSCNWRRQYVILSLFNKYLIESLKTPILIDFIVENIEGSIKFAFQAATSNVELLNIMGMKILSSILQLFSSKDVEEKLEDSLLVSQEAQIIGALMPFFQKGGSPTVIAMAISVCSDFICFSGSITPLIQRVSTILIKLLDSFNENNTEPLFNNIELPTKKFRKMIELSTLDSWAKITKQAIMNENQDLISFVSPYLDALVPLWIVILREYMIAKYVDMTVVTEPFSHVLDDKASTGILYLQEPLWLNLIMAFGSVLQYNEEVVSKCIDNEELESFMFVLLTRCLEMLLKNSKEEIRRKDILLAVDTILNSGVLFNILLEDNIFQEFLSILERSADTDNASEIDLVVKIIDAFITSYTHINNTGNSFLNNINKLYDLLRILFGVLSKILPFTAYGGTESMTDEIILEQSDVDILEHTFGILGKNISAFAPVFKDDLYSCLLYLIGQIYFSKVNAKVIPKVLPLLKVIFTDIIKSDVDYEVLDVFYSSIGPLLFTEKLETDNIISTYLVLVTSGFDHFDNQTLENITTLMSANFTNTSTHALIENNILNLVENQVSSYSASYILRQFFSHLVTSEITDTANATVCYDLFLKYTAIITRTDPNKLGPSIVLFLKFICKAPTLNELVSAEKLEEAKHLFEKNAVLFKEVVSSSLSPAEKIVLEEFLHNQTSFKNKSLQLESITLKSFQ